MKSTVDFWVATLYDVVSHQSCRGTFRLYIQGYTKPIRWRRQVSLIRWEPATRLHGIAALNTLEARVYFNGSKLVVPDEW